MNDSFVSEWAQVEHDFRLVYCCVLFIHVARFIWNIVVSGLLFSFMSITILLLRAFTDFFLRNPSAPYITSIWSKCRSFTLEPLKLCQYITTNFIPLSTTIVDLDIHFHISYQTESFISICNRSHLSDQTFPQRNHKNGSHALINDRSTFVDRWLVVRLVLYLNRKVDIDIRFN